MKKRFQLMKNVIEENELDAVIFFRPDELMMSMQYRPYWGMSIGVFFANGERILYIPALEPTERIPSDVTVKVYPWGTECSDPFKVLYEMIDADVKSNTENNKGVSFVKSIGRTSPPILSGENPPLPSDFIDKLASLGCCYKEIDNEIINLYAYKTEEDIKGLKLCHEVASIGIQAFYKALKVGNTEADVSAEMEYAVRKMIGKKGVIFSQGYAQVQSGINGSFGGTFNWVTNKPLEDGDLVMTEFAVVANGYWADITRTGIVGTPTKEQIHLHNSIKKAQEAAFLLIRPGAKACDVHEAAKTKLNELNLGKFFTHGLGHGVGFRYHDPVGNISKESTDVLEEGMVLTIEPGIYDASFGGIRIEDNILVTKDGYEILSNFTRELRGE